MHITSNRNEKPNTAGSTYTIGSGHWAGSGDFSTAATVSRGSAGSGPGVATSDKGDEGESESKLIMSFMDSVQTTISAAISSELLVESRWREPLGAVGFEFSILEPIEGVMCRLLLVFASNDADVDAEERVGRLRLFWGCE